MELIRVTCETECYVDPSQEKYVVNWETILKFLLPRKDKNAAFEAAGWKTMHSKS